MNITLRVRTLAFLAVLLLATVCVLYSQQSVRCLALLTDLNGEVFVKAARAAEFKKAPWGTQLYAGDVVRTSSAGSACILLTNNNLIALGPGSSMTISESPTSPQKKPITISGISSEQLVDLSGLTMRSTREGEVVALAGLRAGISDRSLEQVSPRNSAIRSVRPSFSWRSNVRAEKYKVKLYNSQGLLWTKETTGTTTEYPGGEEPLKYGEKYFWQVEGLSLVDSYQSTSVGFSLLSIEELSYVESQENNLNTSFCDDTSATSHYFLAGTLYQQKGLLEESIAQFEIVAQRYPDAPAAYEVLGKLYSDVGLKDKAIAALQNALKLSQQQ